MTKFPTEKGQDLIRRTDAPGTDHNARVWILRCLHCNHVYGANSTDAWQRKCPTCQKGKPGLAIPMERHGEDWSREEHTIAFNLYFQLPFGKLHQGNPQIIELAALLGRTPDSVAMKLGNFAHHDPALQERGIQGLGSTSKGVREIWNEFADHPETLAFESEQLRAARADKPLEQQLGIDESELPPPGLERDALVRVRVNQTIFRRRILSAYEFQCCVTGIKKPELLVASHIVPWATDAGNRLNPRNGLCLNALHDRAFDRGLMWIEDDYIVRMAKKEMLGGGGPPTALEWLLSFDGKPLTLPPGYTPDPELIRRHRDLCQRPGRSRGGMP